MKIRLTKAALGDLREARIFIARDDPKAAAMVVRKLEMAVERIASRPSIGRPTIGNGREWSVPGLPYLIPYNVSAESIEILRFWHTSRQRPYTWQ